MTSQLATIKPTKINAPKSKPVSLCPELDKMTDNQTAFRTFAEFCQVMKESNYTPTLRAKTKKQKAFVQTIRMMGFRVWTPEGF